MCMDVCFYVCTPRGCSDHGDHGEHKRASGPPGIRVRRVVRCCVGNLQSSARAINTPNHWAMSPPLVVCLFVVCMYVYVCAWVCVCVHVHMHVHVCGVCVSDCVHVEVRVQLVGVSSLLLPFGFRDRIQVLGCDIKHLSCPVFLIFTTGSPVPWKTHWVPGHPGYLTTPQAGAGQCSGGLEPCPQLE